MTSTATGATATAASAAAANEVAVSRSRGRLAARIGAAAAGLAAAAAISLAGAGAAAAAAPVSQALAPGQGFCTANQYAGYQVRVDGTATGQGVKFKLLFNGAVITNTPGRATNWSAEYRTAYGTFPGRGYYSACAQNTGTTNSIVTLQIRTDGEF